MDKKSNSGVAALPTSRTRDSTLLVPIETAAILINPAEALTVLFYDQYASSRLISEIVSIATRMFLASRYPPVAIYICHGHRCSVIKLIFILRGSLIKRVWDPASLRPPASQMRLSTKIWQVEIDTVDSPCYFGEILTASAISDFSIPDKISG